MSDDRFGAITIQPDPGTPPPQPKKPARPKPGRRSKPDRPDQGAKKNRTWLILAAIPICLFLIYGAGGFLLGPSLLTDYLTTSLQRVINVDPSTGKARFNPFTMRLQLHDITSEVIPVDQQSDRPSTPEPPLFTIDQLSIDLSPMALLGGNLSGNHLRIQGLTISLIRHPDKSYSLPSRTQDNKTDAVTAAPLFFSLNNISIRDSKILFDDRLAEKKHHIEQIRLDLPSLSNTAGAAKEYIRPHFSAIINGSPVELTGEAALPGMTNEGGLTTNLACNIRDLDLSVYFAYFSQSLPLILSKGTANGKLGISFIPDNKKGGRLTIDFQLATAGIELANTDQTLTMNAPAMEINGSLQPLDSGLHLHNLHIMEPRLSAAPARFPRDLAPFFPEPAAARETAEPPHHLAIDTLTVENGVLQLFSPQQSPASPPWTSIQCAIKNFSTLAAGRDKEAGNFTVSGRQEKTNATLNWQGSFSDSGVPGGTLQLQAFPVSDLLGFIDPAQTDDASGVANLSGHLTFDPKARNAGMATLADTATEIHDLTLLDRKQVWLTAKTVKTKGGRFKKDDLDLGAIAIEGATLTLHQEHLPRLLVRFGDSQRPILIHGLEFSGNADLHPQNDKAPPLQLTELRLKADSLANKSNSHKNFDLAAKIHQSGTLKAEGLATLFPLRGQLSLVLAAINAEQIAPWLPDVPLFQQGRAVIDGQGTFRHPESSFIGTLQLGSALFRGGNKESGLTAGKAALNNVSIKAKPLRIGMDELILDTPVFTWQQDMDAARPEHRITAFLRSLLSPTPGAERQPPDKEPGNGHADIPLIKKISFDNGTVNLIDQRLNPPWSPAINQLKGTINNLHDKAQATTFEVAGLFETAPFTLSGGGDFLNSGDIVSTRLDLSGLPLSSLTTRIKPHLDIDPKAATLNLSYSCALDQGKEQGEAQFLFTALRPGSTESAASLPLALLTDDRDQIKFPVPLDKTNTQPLMMQAIAAFQTLMVKAEIAPLLLAGPEFADLDDRRRILFPAGKSTLEGDGEGQKNLRRFAGLLAARPHLGLTLTGMADPLHDRIAIQTELEEKEKKRTAQKNEQRLREWQEKQKQKQQTTTKTPQLPAPGKIIEEDLPKQEAPPALLAPEPVIITDTNLHDLAQERVLSIYDFCTTDLGIASERITLQEKTVLSPQGETGRQVFIGLKALP
jgi:hypothetical protein